MGLKEIEINMNIIDRIKDNQKLIDSSEYRLMPINFGWFSKVVPSFLIDNMLIAGQSGAGKSSITKFLYLSQAIEFAINHNLKFHTLFFALEDSEYVIDYTILCNLYWKKYHEIIDIKLLEGTRRNSDDSIKKLTSEQLKRIEDLQPIFNQYKSYYTVYDDVYEPDEIYNRILNYALQNGKFYKDNRQLPTIEILSNKPFDTYIQNEKTFINVVTDNINLLEGDDLYKAMLYFSFEIGKKRVVKKLGYNFTSVQQLGDETNNLEHQKANAFLPNSSSLGQAKKTGKDSRLSIGITCIADLQTVKSFSGYSIDLMKTYLRILNVFKQTAGVSTYAVPTLFIPQVNQFYLLPVLKKGEEIPEDTLEFIKNILTKIKEYEEI